MKVQLSRRQHFNCAHNQGGHSYTFDSSFEGQIDPHSGMIIDLSVIDVALKKFIAPLHHRHLDQKIQDFKNQDCTTQNLSVYLFTKLGEELPFPKFKRVRLYEDQNLIDLSIQETKKNRFYAYE